MGKIVKKVFFILIISLFFVSGSQAFDSEHFYFPKIKVMNQNMYFGADAGPLFTPGLPPGVIQQVIGEIIASNYPARAAAFAKMIKKSDSDVACLQEAWIFQLAPRPDLGLPEGLNWNFKDLLLEALGDDYKEVVTNEDLFEVDLLTTLGARIKIQDVIIAKKQVKIGKTETHVFNAGFFVPVPTFPEPQKFFRGLSIARLKIRGRWYTFANTHLEAFDAGVRIDQADEVANALDDKKQPILLFGDFNSQPGWPAYDVITDEFDDAWLPRILGTTDPGFTYGRDNLVDDDAVFDERIDFGFIQNDDFITLLGLTVGRREFSKTDPVPYPFPPTDLVRLWPSDHLGLFFIFILPH